MKKLTLLMLMLGAALMVQAQENLSDQQILDLYEGLRVADVSDGMDKAGLWNVGLMDQKIEAMWRDFDNLSHQITGIALTVKYVPTNDPLPGKLTEEQFDAWVGKTYNEVTPEPFVDAIEDGTIIVIDASGDGDTGSVGSFNALAWVDKGARGIVTTGSVRDTDEVAKQRIPVYIDWENRGRGIRPGRNEFHSMQEPIEVGGVLVHPGDVVVADGDGVIVVPRAYAREVAEYALKTLSTDKAARRGLYEKMGKEMDQTVK
ncbi:MAG: RraA family protein [Candidatus Cyclobacteriaceae bacterium M3_2C_046]